MTRVASAAIAVLLALCPAWGTAAGKPDFKRTADRIVESTGVREGDLVMVAGDVRDLELVEELTMAVARRGAHPLQMLAREKTGKRFYTEVPEKYDATRAAFSAKLAEFVTATIQVAGTEFPGLYQDVPAARFATVGKSFQPVTRRMLERGVKQTFVGNGLYPTEATAKQLGLTRAELAQVFWDALATDPARIQANGAAVQAALAGARQVRLTHPNGTDLRFGVEGRTVVLSDGVITPERAARGGAAAILYLPAGEAQLAPAAGTAEGTVVFDRLPTGAGTIEKLRWTFKAGKLASHDARPGKAYDRWKEIYDAAGAGKDVFAGIDLGLHPGAGAPAGKTLLSWIPAGTVSLILGDDTTLGGTNESTYYGAGFLPGATVEVDGKPLVEKGVLRAAAK